MQTTPEQLRDLGTGLLAQNNLALEKLAKELGVVGGRAGLRSYINDSPRFHAARADDVAAKYSRCLAEVEPMMPRFFSLKPKAPYRAVRLEAANEAGMTFGNYEPPTPTQPYGEYKFNASNLDKRSLASACAIIYHELIPGHHFQIALQQESKELPAFRKAGFSYVANNEGWAEYASNLAAEMGAYRDPNDRLGRMALNSMIFSRLVVDVGLNYDGWTLAKAKQFMLDNVYVSETEINSELLRYSADIPAQALGYGAGYTEFLTLRHEAEARQGKAFSVKAFHDAILRVGPVPMSVLRSHLERVLVSSR